MNARQRWLCIIALLGCIGPVRAHETDQFTVPPDRKFADLGGFFNQWAYCAIEQGVNITNDQIRQAIAQRQPPEVLAELQSAPHVTMAVRTQWPWSVAQIETFEKVLASPAMRHRYPGRVVAYGERMAGVYQWAFFPLDIRQFAHILFFSSTIKVYGTYMGTDKLGHFTDEGISYYFEYRKARDAGLDEDQAVARAVRLGTDGIMSESGMLGLAANADYANGDVAGNFAGFLFYRNLTEPMRLKGSAAPSMLARDGAYWKIADDVRPDSDFFARFISDHLDEALNPGYFDPYLRPAMREAVRARTAVLLQHYAGDGRRPHSREWFDRKLRELSTYWGVDYGHRGNYDELVSIGGSCFGPASAGPAKLGPSAAAQLASVSPGPTAEPWEQTPRLEPSRPESIALKHGYGRGAAMDEFGRTALHLAARETQSPPVVSILSGGASIDARDDFGRAPLHDAAVHGSEQAARQLLEAGANPGLADDYGNTPLHLACRRGSLRIAQQLIAHGADANARSAAGTTPLHEAALVGDAVLVRLLLDQGAAPAAADNRGRTPADVASAHGFPQVAVLLRSAPPSREPPVSPPHLKSPQLAGGGQ